MKCYADMLRPPLLLALTSMFVPCAVTQSTAPLRSKPGQDAVRATRSSDSFSSMREVRASFQANLIEANVARRGEAWLELSLGSPEAPRDRITVRIPISSTEDAYGESRSCHVDGSGRRNLVFTAGLDEPNFVAFRSATEAHDFSFLLNKYLCRVLASPFHCDGREIALPKSWGSWNIARHADVRLSSDAPAAMRLSPVFLTSGDKPFDYARCAVEASSDGICCVMGRTTAWHCGGRPGGTGWHQVSGECWHRETGGACNDK